MEKQIKLIPSNDQSCGWIKCLGPRENFPVLEGNHSADWVIIGGGFTGIAFARRMAVARPNDKIIILDAAAIGEGASARNSGFAVGTSTFGSSFHPDKLPEFKRINRINQAGINSLRELVDDYQISCQWREVGRYNCGAEDSTTKSADDFVSWLQAADVEFEDLSGKDLSKRLGIPYYQRGIWTKGDVLLNPAALVRGLSRSLPDNVALFDHSPAIKISDHSGKIHVDCPEGAIIAKQLVLAGNAYLHAMAPYPVHTIPLTLTSSLSRRLTRAEQAALGDPSDWGIISLHSMGATLRYTQDHRILIRNTASYRAAEPYSTQQMQSNKQIHQTGLRERFPMLADLTIEHTWQGVLSVSRNSTSFFGKLGERIYASGCYNGSGISKGSAMGVALADFALGDSNQLLEDVIKYPSPKWMPSRPLLDIGMMIELKRRGYGAGADA
ncbi:MAG: FAD-binding oxidoreductase [Pseudomonadales bacterium]|nr:FAD-binding oxidoreductase [Pseudomonadales bacterium]NRA14541.1 FAD-binding oxidoreductase [Oceanospirillaceae bacterium]